MSRPERRVVYFDLDTNSQSLDQEELSNVEQMDSILGNKGHS